MLTAIGVSDMPIFQDAACVRVRQKGGLRMDRRPKVIAGRDISSRRDGEWKFPDLLA
jgi:hypothetical protein